MSPFGWDGWPPVVLVVVEEDGHSETPLDVVVAAGVAAAGSVAVAPPVAVDIAEGCTHEPAAAVAVVVAVVAKQATPNREFRTGSTCFDLVLSFNADTSS